jgi:hypothetical protein
MSMFCPECRGEFREGFTHCVACDRDLVAALEPLPEPDASELVPLVSTADVPFLMLLKSVLEAEGIAYSLSGEESLRLLTILPSGGHVAPLAVNATIFVHPTDLLAAQQLLSTHQEPEP